MYAKTERDKRYDEWHAMMLDAGWTPIRDRFDIIHTYQFIKPDGKLLQVTSSEFAAWVGLMQTPPPF